MVKRTSLQWIMVTLALMFVVGCTSANPSSKSDSVSQIAPSAQTAPLSSTTQTTDTTTKELLVNMKQMAEHGKVINSAFSVKTTIMEDVKREWGEPDKTDWVAAAKGNYATYSNQAIVFGFNKGSQIFEVRSFDKQLQKISLAKTKEIFGTPVLDVKFNGEEIIGYTSGPEFKMEFVFPLPTANDPNPMMVHYLILYPKGTVNNMTDDPGRQW